jgi:ribosomal protein S27AE
MPGTPLLNPRRIEPERPPCPTCGVPMWIVRVEPLPPDHQKHVWECPKCGHEATMLAKRG